MKEAVIHFLNGYNTDMELHYYQKDYRDDVVVELDGLFYEVYFFTSMALNYEMTGDGFFSFPGIIILDEISTGKIINAIKELNRRKFFEHFQGHEALPLNNRFLNSWYLNGAGMDTYINRDAVTIRLD